MVATLRLSVRVIVWGGGGGGWGVGVGGGTGCDECARMQVESFIFVDQFVCTWI